MKLPFVLFPYQKSEKYLEVTQTTGISPPSNDVKSDMEV
jgi:hypothetical protein